MGRVRFDEGVGLGEAAARACGEVAARARPAARAVGRALAADAAFGPLVLGAAAAFGAVAGGDAAWLQARAAARAAGGAALAAASFGASGAGRRRGADAAGSSGGGAGGGRRGAGGGRRRPKPTAELLREMGWLLGIAFRGRGGSRGLALLGAQMLLLLARAQIGVKAAKVNIYYLTKSIAQGSWDYWVKWLFSFGGWTVCGVVVNSGLKYVELALRIHMRRQITRRAHELYLKGGALYSATVLGEGELGSGAGLDQRIAADVDSFCKKTAHLYGHSFKPLLEFVMSLKEASGDLGYARPLCLFAVNGLVSSLLRASGPRVGRMVAREAELEGTFRRAHARLIANSEEVSFLGGQPTERRILDEKMEQLLQAQGSHNLQKIQRNLSDQFIKFFGMLSGGFIIHMPWMMRGQGVPAAERISSFRTAEELMFRCGGSFTEVLMLHTNLAELSGYTSRLYATMRALERLSTLQAGGMGAPVSGGDSGSDGTIVFEDLTVAVPEKDAGPSSPRGGGGSTSSPRLLIRGLNMRVEVGASTLVTGPNGCGKTSLFRVLAGLWPAVSGACARPSEGLMWLPQRPYLVLGTLRDQVAYPTLLGFGGAEDARVEDALRQAGLGKMLDRAAKEQAQRAQSSSRRRRNASGAGDRGAAGAGAGAGAGSGLFSPLSIVHEEWADVLSGGERQRLGFARLFFHRPRFAVLDEATSAINPDEEAALYAGVARMGTTMLSIAHRLELRKFHQRELKVRGDGSGAWELQELR